MDGRKYQCLVAVSVTDCHEAWHFYSDIHGFQMRNPNDCCDSFLSLSGATMRLKVMNEMS